MQTEYVIKLGGRIVWQNREGLGKEELKAKRDTLAAKAGLNHYARLRQETDPATQRALRREINHHVMAGRLHHVGRK